MTDADIAEPRPALCSRIADGRGLRSCLWHSDQETPGRQFGPTTHRRAPKRKPYAPLRQNITVLTPYFFCSPWKHRCAGTPPHKRTEHATPLGGPRTFALSSFTVIVAGYAPQRIFDKPRRRRVDPRDRGPHRSVSARTTPRTCRLRDGRARRVSTEEWTQVWLQRIWSVGCALHIFPALNKPRIGPCLVLCIHHLPQFDRENSERQVPAPQLTF